MEQTLLTELILVFVFQVVLFFRADIFLGFFSKDAEILMLASELHEDYCVWIFRLCDYDGCDGCVSRVWRYKNHR